MERAKNNPVAGFLYGAIGLALFFALWQWAGKAGLAGPSLPAVGEVAKTLSDAETFRSLERAARYTLASAARGLLLGGSCAIFLAIVTHLLPPLRPGLDRLAVLVNAAPPIAIGPVLIVIFSRDQTPSVLAGIQVFFLLYVSMASGLASAAPSLLRVMDSFGANRWKRLLYLELPISLPYLAGGLKAAISAAFIGAILGEWFGAPQGLGIVILNAMENFQIPLMWAAVSFAALLAVAAFLVASGIEKLASRRFAK